MRLTPATTVLASGGIALAIGAATGADVERDTHIDPATSYTPETSARLQDERAQGAALVRNAARANAAVGLGVITLAALSPTRNTPLLAIGVATSAVALGAITGYAAADARH